MVKQYVKKRPARGEMERGSILVVLLFSAMFLDAVEFPGLGVPANSIAMGVAVLYGAMALRSGPLGHSPVLAPLALAIPVWMAMSSLLNDNFDTRRLLNITLYAALILVLASGRLSPRHVGRGLAVAVVIGVAWGAATLPQSGYIGRLTGPFGDPNAAGLVIAVATAIALSALQRPLYRYALLLVALLGVYLTESRTTILAVALMGLWLLFGRYGSPWLGLAVVGALLWWISNIPQEDFATGEFADRAGSDALRERIYAVETIEVARHPTVGNGAGTARILLDGQPFFYHSSYLAIRAEAGWIGFVLVVGLLALAFLALITLPRLRRNAWYEAALLGVAVCAMNLGEVLLTLPAAVAIGLAFHHRAAVRGAWAQNHPERPQNALPGHYRVGILRR
jgi:O-antigen ligase